MTRTRLAGLGTALALVAALVTQVGTAGAARVRPSVVTCGQVITANTTLAADVGPCPGDGIIVAADNITLNLNNRKVIGSGDETDNRVGVRLPHTTGVTVTRGTITGFSSGVYINGTGPAGGNQGDGTGGNTLSKLFIHDNYGPDDGAAAHGDGVFIHNSRDNRVTSNTIARNGFFDGVIVAGTGSIGNRIDHNTIRDHNRPARSIQAPEEEGGLGLYCIGVTSSIDLGAGFSGGHVTKTRIDNNTITRSGLTGIHAGYINFPVVAYELVIENNTLSEGGLDPDGTSGCPPWFDNADRHNSGMTIGSPGIPPGNNGLCVPSQVPECRDMKATIRNNTVRRFGGTGISVTATGGVQILNNTALENAKHGPAPDDITVDLFDVDCGYGNIWRGNVYTSANGGGASECIVTPANYQVGFVDCWWCPSPQASMASAKSEPEAREALEPPAGGPTRIPPR